MPKGKGKVKAIPLQVWSGPDGSRKLTLQCGVTSTARHSENISCSGVTSTARHSENISCSGVMSTARHAPRSHSFVYISTTWGSKCNRATSCFFIKELAILWCGKQLLEFIYSFFLCSRILGFLFAVHNLTDNFMRPYNSEMK